MLPSRPDQLEPAATGRAAPAPDAGCFGCFMAPLEVLDILVFGGCVVAWVALHPLVSVGLAGLGCVVWAHGHRKRRARERALDLMLFPHGRGTSVPVGAISPVRDSGPDAEARSISQCQAAGSADDERPLP